MTERFHNRKHPRIYVEIPARLSCAGEDGFAAIMTRQIGIGGCMLIGNKFLEAGSAIALTLLIDDRSIDIISRVLYEFLDNGVILSGIKFIDIHDSDIDIIDSFLNQHLSQPKAAVGTPPN